METASTRDVRPKLRRALGMLRAGDTLVIYKPDRVARSMKELLFLLEDQLRARRINLHILSGICAGLHRPDGAAIADTMLFTVAAMAAEMECDLIRERTLDGLRAARILGRRGGRPAAVNDDMLAIARGLRGLGESVTAIAGHLGVGRSTLYRALDPGHDSAAPLVLRAADKVYVSAETLLSRTGWPLSAAEAPEATASISLIRACFVASSRNDARTPLAARLASRDRLSPSAEAARRYSSVSVVPNIGASSLFSVTNRPSVSSRGSGCASRSRTCRVHRPDGAAQARARSEQTWNRPGEGEVLPSAAGR